MTWRALITPEEATRRLASIFPRATFDTTLSNPLAGVAIAAMIYIDAVSEPAQGAGEVTWARPSTCIWFSTALLGHTSDEERAAWRTAAARSRAAVESLHQRWGEGFTPLYADNSRETLRDETFRGGWLNHGALRMRPDLPTSSSAPRWALVAAFAAMFDPALSGEDLAEAIDAWQERTLSTGARTKALYAADHERRQHQVDVVLPNGDHRSLEPGQASLLLKGVIEVWAPRRLGQPAVLTISEPGDKVNITDARTLQALGVGIDVANVLPDALLVDLATDPVTFWVVEAVASDGPVDEARRRALLAWASAQGIDEGSCRFLSAFISRGDGAAKRRLKDLASGTYAWYADEPEHELAWDELP